MYQNNQLKTTTGLNQEVLIGGTAYANEATLQALFSTGTHGESAVYVNNQLKTTALSAGESFVVAVKRDAGIATLAPILFGGATKIVKTEGNNRVNKVVTVVVSYGGTNGFRTTADETESYQIRIVDETSVARPYPSWDYYHSAKKTKTIKQVLETLQKKINDDTIGINATIGRVVTMSNITDVAPNGATPGTLTFTLTSLSSNPFNFSLYIGGFESAVATVTTEYQSEHLTSDFLKQFEKEGDLYNGVKNEFLEMPLTKEGWGSPTSMVASGSLFTMYTITTTRNEKALGPYEDHNFHHVARVVVPKDSAAETAYDTVFGIV